MATVLTNLSMVNYHLYILHLRGDIIMSKPLIPTSEYENIIKLYESGLSQIKIGDMYNVGYYIIGKILRKCGIVARDDSHKFRKYTIDENYFDIIDTPNKAYILGLLYSDGCNYPPQHRVKLELQERDRKILDKINVEIQSNKPLAFNNLSRKNINWQNTYRLDITNRHISNKLVELGMVQNKSLVLEFPKWLDNDMYAPFLRGYLDGDGHIEWSATKFITLVGTSQFCNHIKDFCEEKLGVKCSISNTANKDSNTKLLYISGKPNIKQFLDFVYKDADLYIERKYNIYQKICTDMNISNSLLN